MIIPVVITVFADKSFTFVTESPCHPHRIPHQQQGNARTVEHFGRGEIVAGNRVSSIQAVRILKLILPR
jgi:ribosomal protein L11